MISVLALLMASLFSGEARARCREAFTNEQLGRLVGQGMEGFAYRKLAPFNRARAEIQAGIPCLEEVVDPVALAGYYGLQALSLYGENLEYQPDMMRYLQIAVTLDPAYSFGAEAVPKGHELWDLLEEARRRPVFVETTLPDSRYQAFIDGRATDSWAPARPMVLQLMAPNGRLRYTELLVASSEDELPDLITRSGRRSTATWIGVSSLGLSVVAGGLTAASLLSERQFYELTEPIHSGRGLDSSMKTSIDRSYSRANAFGIAAQATGGVALGLGVTAVLVFPW